MKPSNDTNSSVGTSKSGGRRYLILRLADFSKRHVAVFAVLFGAIGGVWLLNNTSAGHPTPSIYLTPDTQTLTPGSTFQVQIREDSGAASVNAVSVRLNYPANLLECVGHPDGAGSGFDIDIEQQRYKGSSSRWNQGTCPVGQGKVILNRGSIDGITGDRLVATVTFKVKGTAGTADLAFATGTELSSADTSADILGSLSATVGGHYQIGAGGTATPSPTTSGNHPVPSIYMTPSTQNVTPGSVLTVQIHEDSGSTPVNAIAVVLNYPKDLLECTAHPDGTGGAFDFDIEQQRYGNSPKLWDQATCPIGKGQVVFNRGMIDGVSGDHLVATVSFRVKAKSGTVDLTFGDGTQLNSAETSNDILGSLSATIGGKFTIGPADMRGDLNKDGKIDNADLTILLLHWQTNDAVSDIDRSGTVDVTDMSILLSGFNMVVVKSDSDGRGDLPRPSINLGDLLAKFIKGLINSADVIKQLNTINDKGGGNGLSGLGSGLGSGQSIQRGNVQNGLCNVTIDGQSSDTNADDSCNDSNITD